MPTVGWIQEDAIERFWESPYPREQYLSPGISCPYCRRQFQSSDDLSTHLGLDHPLDIPTLHLNSKPVLTEFDVRVPLDPSDISLLNCTSCEVRKDGGKAKIMKPSRLPAFLAAERSSTCELRLFNERVINHNTAVVRFIARFSIPSAESLNSVDKEFLKRLAVEHPCIADVDAFRVACPD
jgi:hypothetical protein